MKFQFEIFQIFWRICQNIKSNISVEVGDVLDRKDYNKFLYDKGTSYAENLKLKTWTKARDNKGVKFLEYFE